MLLLGTIPVLRISDNERRKVSFSEPAGYTGSICYGRTGAIKFLEIIVAFSRVGYQPEFRPGGSDGDHPSIVLAPPVILQPAGPLRYRLSVNNGIVERGVVIIVTIFVYTLEGRCNIYFFKCYIGVDVNIQSSGLPFFW